MKSLFLSIIALFVFFFAYGQQKVDSIYITEPDSIAGFNSENYGNIVKNDHFNEGIIFSPLQLLSSREPGFNFNCLNNYDPNPHFDFQVRGISELMFNTQALYIVDEIPVTNPDFISPECIESIELLKSVSERVNYGLYAFEGVIKITTKKAINEKTQIKFSTSTYFETPHFQMMDAAKWRETVDYWRTNKINYYEYYLHDYGNSTNWVKEISQNKFNQIYNLGISKRIKNLYFTSNLSYKNLNGFLQKNDRTNYNVLCNLDYSALKKRLKFNLTYINNNNDFSQINYNPVFDDLQFGVFYNHQSFLGYTESFNPTITKIPVNGIFQADTFKTLDNLNPLEILSKIHDSNIQKDQFAKIDLNYLIFKPLKIKLYYSYNKSIFTGDYSIGKIITNASNNQYEAFYEISKKFNQKVIGSKLEYIAGLRKHEIKTEIGIQYLKSDDIYQYYDSIVSYGTYRSSGGLNTSPNSKVQYQFRFGYYYNNSFKLNGKYNIEKLNSFLNNRLPFFHSYTLQGSLSLKKFIPNGKLNWINEINIIADYGNLERMSLLILPFPDTINNRVNEIEYGFNMTMLEKNLSLNICRYHKTNSHVYKLVVLSSGTGFNYRFIPLNIKNSGLEFKIDGKYNIFGFKFYHEFNFAINNNLQLIPDKSKPYLAKTDSLPVGNIFAQRFAGFDKYLRPLYYDNDGNKVTSNTNIEPTYFGSTSPKYFAGYYTNIEFKGFEISFLLKGAFKFIVINNEIFSSLRQNFKSDFDITLPSLPPYKSDYYIENGNYLKLEFISLAYKIPLYNKIIKELKFNFSCNSVFYLFKKNGIKPDMLSISSEFPGYYYGQNYPITSVYQLGISGIF
jgi:TonB-dependent starch-binding outer membrane protein SusC